jgi:hypothetical protein
VIYSSLIRAPEASIQHWLNLQFRARRAWRDYCVCNNCDKGTVKLKLLLYYFHFSYHQNTIQFYNPLLKKSIAWAKIKFLIPCELSDQFQFVFDDPFNKPISVKNCARIIILIFLSSEYYTISQFAS